MERRKCGRSNLTLPVLGIGCWAFGGNESDYWGIQDDADIAQVVHAALDAGVNYFDTAEGYNDGRSEEALGKALKNRRNEAIIGTKVSPSFTRPDLLRQHCEASLRRLGTDTIDLYMVHWPIIEYPVEPAFAALAELQAQGKIRHIGLSNFGVRQLQEVLQTGVEIASDQLYYNLISRAIEFEILPETRRREIGVVAYMPYQQGLLTGKYLSLEDVPPIRLRTRHFRGSRALSRHGGPGAEDEVISVLNKIRVVTDETGIKPAHLALAWLLHQPGITCALAGIRSIPQLLDGINGASVKCSPDLVKYLDDITQSIKQTLGPNADYFEGSEESRIR